MTGVQQYAARLALYLKKNFAGKIDFVSPKGILHTNMADELGVQVIGNTKGFFWEQVELPFWLKRQGSPLLINFGNVAPQHYHNQVVTIHDLSTLEHPEWFSSKFARAYKFMIPQVVHNCRKVIAVSEFTRKRIHQLLNVPLANIEVIYNSLDQPPDQLSSQRRNYFLSIGSFSSRKNFTTLIKGFQLANLPGIDLKIRGDHDQIFKEENELNEIVNQHPHIHFIEPLNYAAYLDLISNAKAVINTSIYEGFGMPNLEALSMGTPVICSDIEVFREINGELATFVDPKDPESIAWAIQNLAQNSAKHHSKQELQKRAALFNTETEGKKLLTLILQTFQHPIPS